jgi:ribonuclease E
LRNDRARIQVGRISHFGLLEMSRQRLRTGMLEGSTSSCAMCQGTGIVRSVESIALDVLRSLEDRLITDGVIPLVATTSVEVALYILNQKRSHLKDIEQRYQIPITVTADEDLHVSQFIIERSTEIESGAGESPVVQMDWAHHQPGTANGTAAVETESEQARRRSRRRRRKRRGPELEGEALEVGAEAAETDAEDEAGDEAEPQEAKGPEGGAQGRGKPRRRGRRGGRRGRGGQRSDQAAAEAAEDGAPAGEDQVSRDEAEAQPQQNGDGRKEAHEAEPSPDRAEEKPARREEPVFATVPEPAAPAEVSVKSEVKEDSAPPRRGWWSR